MSESDALTLLANEVRQSDETPQAWDQDMFHSVTPKRLSTTTAGQLLPHPSGFKFAWYS